MGSFMAGRFAQMRPIIASLRKVNCNQIFVRQICMPLHMANVKLHLLNAEHKNVKLSPFCSFKTWAEDRKRLNVKDIEDRVLKILHGHDKIDKNKVTLDSHFMNDLGLDSLDHIEIIMAIEDEFTFQIKDLDAEKLFRPVDIVNFIKTKDDEWVETMDEADLPR